MTLTFLTDRTAERMAQLDERIVREWNARHPDVPVTLSLIDHEELKEKLGDLLADERPADVMTWVAGNRSESLTGDGLMLDVTPLWHRDDLSRAYDPRFRPGRGETAYYLPTSQYWWAVYYRRSVLESLGIATPVENWEDLRAAARVLKSAGIAPFALGAKHHCPTAAWFDYLNMRINGSAFHRELLDLSVPYTDDRVRSVFAFWQRLLDDGWFLGSPTDHDEQDAVDALLDGRAGMTLIGAYVSDEYLPDDQSDIDLFRFPILDPRLPVGEDAPVDGYFAAGRTAAPEQAKEFLAYLGSRQVQQLTVETLTVLPTRDDVDVTRAAPHVVKGMDVLRRADAVSQFYDLDTPWELAEVGMAAFQAFLREPGRAGELLRMVEDRRAQLRRL